LQEITVEPDKQETGPESKNSVVLQFLDPSTDYADFRKAI